MKILSNCDIEILILGQDEEFVEFWDEVKNCVFYFNYVFGILIFQFFRNSK